MEGRVLTPSPIGRRWTTVAAAAAAALCAALLEPVAASAATQLVASPSSLSFSGTPGGANPPRQNVNITSSDGTAAGFTVGVSKPWMAIGSISSSTTPSTVSLGVNLSGLAAGSYTGTLTIGSSSKTVVGTTVSVTLTVSAPSPELITNGGFEGTASPWVLSGNAQRSTSFPLDGTGHLLIGSTSDAGSAYQQITIPSTAQAADLEYYLSIRTLETSTTTVAYDKLNIEVRNTSGALLSTLAAYSNLDQRPANEAYVHHYGVSLIQYKGQTVRLQFSGQNDASFPTSFRVDDVSVSTAFTPSALNVTPPSLSFSGVAGGTDPGSQSLAIALSGSGTLSWATSANQAWLSVTKSGMTPGNATVAVSLAGLAGGTYNATVTVSASGATNSPVSVPVTLTVTTVGPELVTNGTFSGNSVPWIPTGQAGYTTGSTAPSGYGYEWFGSTNLANGKLYQPITISSSATSANLTFWMWVNTQESAGAGAYDKLFVEVTNTSGAVLATLATFSNLDVGFNNWMQRGTFSMLAFKGQTVRLQFRVTTDGSNPTTFRIDDVSVK